MKNEKQFIEKSSIKHEFTGSHKMLDFIRVCENSKYLFDYIIYAIALGELDYKFDLENEQQLEKSLNRNEAVKIVIFDDLGCMCGRAGVAILDVKDDSIIMIKTMRMA